MRDAETKKDPDIDETHSSATGTSGLDCTYALLITRHREQAKETPSSWTANALPRL
jgi:hypothetical protein